MHFLVLAIQRNHKGIDSIMEPYSVYHKSDWHICLEQPLAFQSIAWELPISKSFANSIKDSLSPHGKELLEIASDTSIKNFDELPEPLIRDIGKELFGKVYDEYGNILTDSNPKGYFDYYKDYDGIWDLPLKDSTSAYCAKVSDVDWEKTLERGPTAIIDGQGIWHRLSSYRKCKISDYDIRPTDKVFAIDCHN